MSYDLSAPLRKKKTSFCKVDPLWPVFFKAVKCSRSGGHVCTRTHTHIYTYIENNVVVEIYIICINE